MDELLELLIVLAVFVLIIAVVSRSVRAILLVGVCIFMISLLALAGVIG